MTRTGVRVEERYLLAAFGAPILSTVLLQQANSLIMLIPQGETQRGAAQSHRINVSAELID